ncbi:MAG: helix-turn-helix transcriptional regulator [Terriglobia bacterium]|jgi:DNA-binding CsgD family transcriptional regulator
MGVACQVNASYVPIEGRQDFGLTARERQVIALVSASYTNKDVAEKLGISQNTAKHHLSNVFDKLGVSNRLELLIFAVYHGLTEQE